MGGRRAWPCIPLTYHLEGKGSALIILASFKRRGKGAKTQGSVMLPSRPNNVCCLHGSLDLDLSEGIHNFVERNLELGVDGVPGGGVEAAPHSKEERVQEFHILPAFCYESFLELGVLFLLVSEVLLISEVATEADLQNVNSLFLFDGLHGVFLLLVHEVLQGDVVW